MGEAQLSGGAGLPFVAAVANDYAGAIRAAAGDPRRLEELYRAARGARQGGRFADAVRAAHRDAPDDLLYAAWYYRLEHGAMDEGRAGLAASWRLAAPLSVALGAVLWLLSAPALTLARGVPLLVIVWAPITALFLIGFLAPASRRHVRASALAGGALIAVTGYALAPALGQLDGGPAGQDHLLLLALHLPLLAGAAVGVSVLGWGSSARDRFGFLTKAIETIGTAGVASIAGGIFVGLTYGLFEALSVDIPDPALRLLIVGGGGLIPVLAVATVYDPALPPGAQEFRRGFGRILGTLMRALLAPTLLVLVVYLAFIPFNFMQPFVNRDVLIVYNGLLFAIVALLVGATPVELADVAPRARPLLRAALALLAALVVLVSLYALAAVVYRTVAGGVLTMNRLVVIGWNGVNIGLLVALLIGQARAPADGWVDALQRVFRVGTVAYVAWGALVVLALPWLA
jgi:hypothetical protein